MRRLTDRAYWDRTYAHVRQQRPLNVESFTGRPNRLILNKLQELNLSNKRLLEIGAGDSKWLPYLARKYPCSTFVGVDYSELGCKLLAARAHRENSNVAVVREDMFTEHSELHGTFDIVMSIGVVEHFDELGRVLAAKARFLRDGGTTFTVIPNLAGVLGTLTRLWNRDVYNRHIPHDLESFLQGHRASGLKRVSGMYLGSNNFGVLSACFIDRRGLSWLLSNGLIAVSVATWWLEDRIGDFPTTRTFAPYIYAIGHKD